ncbi:MAG: hypothetical protein JW741_04650 [Sedimentisphaerales bacterium]|nr:hypothetical protein [Sedimentisphaerales bacterium]
MDQLTTKLISLLQARFPLEPRPFDTLADQLACSPADALAATQKLAEKNILRSIGPFFNAQRLGYTTTLVAGAIPDPDLGGFVTDVNALPTVSHNYARTGRFNLWFTLAAPTCDLIEDILDSLRDRYPDARLHSLPAIRRYKLRTTFQPTAGAKPIFNTPEPPANPAHEPLLLSEQHIRVIRVIQEPLELIETPFDTPAHRAGCSVEKLLHQLHDWHLLGLLRRFAARVRHTRLGYTANALLVLVVPPDRIHAAGETLAQSPNVSHCYHRPPVHQWPFNIYAMLHARTSDELARLAEQLAASVQASQRDLLRTTVEYKKEPTRFFTETAP